MTSPSATEQRVFYRIPMELTVHYQWLPAKGLELQGSTVNLSAGGMLLCCALPEPSVVRELVVGRMALLVALEVPGFGPLRVEARAMWMERLPTSCRLGLKFQDMPEADQRRLQDAILAWAP